MQNVKRMKKAKKAKIKVYSIYLDKTYSVICPFCHVELVGGIGTHTLMFVCSECGNTIDLRDKEGKRAYEKTMPKPEIEFCKCYPEHEYMKRDVCISCGKLKSNVYH